MQRLRPNWSRISCSSTPLPRFPGTDSLARFPASAEINDFNRATAGSYSVQPVYQEAVGHFADSEARYTFPRHLRRGCVVRPGEQWSLGASAQQWQPFQHLTWGLGYSFRDVSDRNGGIGGDNQLYL